MYPSEKSLSFGIFIEEQVMSLRKEGVEVDVLFVDGTKNKLNYLWGIFRLWGRLLTHRYDLIHAHYVFSGIIARTQFLCPVVLTHHGPEFWNWQFTPCRIITPLVDKVILVSPEMYERLKFKKAEVIPCGVDFDLFKPMSKEQARKELGIAPDKKLILWVGAFTRPEKRFDIVQEAVALAKQKDPTIDFLLVAGKHHHEIPKYMNAGDVVLLTSDAEGSPMVIKEAMACNIPVVSVSVGDVADVIGGTDGCYLCTQDPVDVAEKLLLALSYGKRTNGRENTGHLELSQIAKRIVSQYQEVLNRKRPRILSWFRRNRQNQ
jgi:glycosyltransferase involved in cell wall biosynthesis